MGIPKLRVGLEDRPGRSVIRPKNANPGLSTSVRKEKFGPGLVILDLCRAGCTNEGSL